MFKTMCALAIFSLSFSAAAQDFPVDVALTAELSKPLPWQLGTNQEIRLILSNLSNRGTRGRIRVVGIQTPGLQTDLWEFVSESCFRNADCEQFGRFCYDTPSIPAFSTATCVVGRRPVEIRQQPISLRYTYEDLVSNHFEPNLSNNSVDVRITLIEPPAVQVPLSPWTYGLISLLMIGCGAIAARRWA